MTRTWRSRDELVHQIVTLDADKVPWRAIARATGVSRNTVSAILHRRVKAQQEPHSALTPPPRRAPRPKKIDAFTPRIQQLLVAYPDITAQRVFEILTQEDGFAGGYTAVKKHMRIARPPPRPAPSLQTPAWGPGKMAENDWSLYKVPFTNGDVTPVQAFSYVLPFSTRKFFAFFLRCDLHALMDGHLGAFERFKGCAEGCTYDSQKGVVLRWEGPQPIYNPRFLAFAAHYNFRPRAVRAAPNAKPRVERSFWELERSFFNGRSFLHFDDLQCQLADWLDRVVDQRHQGRALERFREEQPALRPLPNHPYDTARVVYRLASIDGFVDWEGNRYAVPYDHVTDFLPVRVTQREVFIYGADFSCVAVHELAPRGARRKVDPNGIHRSASRPQGADHDQLIATFRGLGAGGERFVALLTGSSKTWPYQAKQILQLRARYQSSDIDAALAHALRFGALDARAIARILEARAKPRSFEEYVSEQTARRLAGTLGVKRIEARDLKEFDRLPSISATLPTHVDEPVSCPIEDPTPTIPTTRPSDSDDTSGSSD